MKFKPELFTALESARLAWPNLLEAKDVQILKTILAKKPAKGVFDVSLGMKEQLRGLFIGNPQFTAEVCKKLPIDISRAMDPLLDQENLATRLFEHLAVEVFQPTPGSGADIQPDVIAVCSEVPEHYRGLLRQKGQKCPVCGADLREADELEGLE